MLPKDGERLPLRVVVKAGQVDQRGLSCRWRWRDAFNEVAALANVCDKAGVLD